MSTRDERDVEWAVSMFMLFQPKGPMRAPWSDSVHRTSHQVATGLTISSDRRPLSTLPESPYEQQAITPQKDKMHVHKERLTEAEDSAEWCDMGLARSLKKLTAEKRLELRSLRLALDARDAAQKERERIAAARVPSDKERRAFEAQWEMCRRERMRKHQIFFINKTIEDEEEATKKEMEEMEKKETDRRVQQMLQEHAQSLTRMRNACVQEHLRKAEKKIQAAAEKQFQEELNRKFGYRNDLHRFIREESDHLEYELQERENSAAD